LKRPSAKRIFDLLDEGPKSLSDLAALGGVSPLGLRAILPVLAGFNLLAKHSEGRYSLTPESAAFLVSNRPGYMGGFIRHTSTQLLPLWLKINDAVETSVKGLRTSGEAAATRISTKS
jgi:hypothetical protein